MRVVLLHGFAGDPAVWDGICDGRALSLPGHGCPVRDSWDANLDAVAEAAGAIELVIGYSLGARRLIDLRGRRPVCVPVLVVAHERHRAPHDQDEHRDAGHRSEEEQ